MHCGHARRQCRHCEQSAPRQLDLATSSLSSDLLLHRVVLSELGLAISSLSSDLLLLHRLVLSELDLANDLEARGAASQPGQGSDFHFWNFQWSQTCQTKSSLPEMQQAASVSCEVVAALAQPINHPAMLRT